MNVDFTKPVQTRDGRKVRIYATDGSEHGWQIHGATSGGSFQKLGWWPTNWYLDGRVARGYETALDLVNVPTPDPAQTYTISVRDIYGDTALEAPKGYRFKVENGVCAFRRVNRDEPYLPKVADGFDVLFGSNGNPRLILEKEST